MALLSPGIQINESSVTPATTVAYAENGVATLGFSTRGPVGKLTKISSVSEFNQVFGDPIEDMPYAHIMSQAVLANNTDLYFMRLATSDAAAANCPMVDFEMTGATVAIRDNLSTDEAGYFIAEWAPVGEDYSEPTHSDTITPTLRIMINPPDGGEDVTVDTTLEATKTFSPGGSLTDEDNDYFLYAPIASVIANLNANSTLSSYYDFTIVNNTADSNSDAEIGILITCKDTDAFTSDDLDVRVSIGYADGDTNTWIYWDTDACGGQSGLSDEKVKSYPTVKTSDTFDDVELGTNSSRSTWGGIDNYNHFNLTANFSGSAMNGVRVVKTTTTSVNGDETWNVSVYDTDDETLLESRTGITADTLLDEMAKFYYINITDEVLVEDEWTFKDGTYDLGYGELLANGDYWDDTTIFTGDYAIVEGTDGYPEVTIGDTTQYSEPRAIKLYLDGLGSDEFVNCDEYSFSILATPGIQNTLVQNAAIDVCSTRGDAIYLADVPYDYCVSKDLIDTVVSWANGNSGFQSSYCAIYYGWFYQTNPYDSDNSIACPASCFLAPKMVALDQSMGEFYAPAGITRGSLICSDYLYSPDQKDRDKLVGDDNVVNPISYSNTRGVSIMSQKTTDRTTSPLNRVGIRRMTNMIKRKLRSKLVEVLFEPNNEISRAKARTIVDDIMSSLRSGNCIDSYDIDVVSGTGSNRNTLNIYLSFAPYALIEKIYVFVNITDVDVEVTETVA